MRPPLWGRLLLRLRWLGRQRDETASDLEELFQERRVERGRRYATARYYMDVASLWIYRPRPGGASPDRLAPRSLSGLQASSPWALLDTIVFDLRYAVRTLGKQPLLTGAVVLTLAIGIAAPTSMFSLLNGWLFRTPVSSDPDAFFRVVRAHRGGGQGIATTSLYDALREESRSVRELAAWSDMGPLAPLGREDPTRVPGLLVSCNFFRLFGVDAPEAGRLLQSEDCAAASPVAVMSEALWRARFAADPAIVGSSLVYGGVRLTIIGVADMAPIQREAHDPDEDYVVDLWFPYTAYPLLRETSELGEILWADDRSWLELAGLLDPGVSRRAAEIELRLIQVRHEDASELAPENASAAWFREQTALILTDGARWGGMRGDDAVLAFALSLTMPGLVMLTACINVAALLLSRAVGRRREMAVRLALGTSRGALLRMLLVESLLVSGLASLASLLFVYRLPAVLVRFFEAELWFGAADSVTPDGKVLVFLLASGVLAAAISGLSPALESLNPRLAEVLQGRRGFVSGRGPSRTRSLFVGIQVAACVVLLVSAVAFARTATRVTDPGFTTEGLIVAELHEEENEVPIASLAEELVSTAGVSAIAYSGLLPLARERSLRIRVPGESGWVAPLVASISPGYFEAFGITVLAGRTFDRSEDVAGEAAAEPVVVSRRFVERFFPAGGALGATIEAAQGDARMQIIGIADNRTVGRSFTQPALGDGSMIYRLMEPSSTSGFLIVEAEGDPAALIGGLAAALRELTGSPTAIETFAARLADEVVAIRRVQTLLLAMGGIALLLSVVGVIASVWADAGRRRREFAIRLALGAGPGALRRRVLASGMWSVQAGVVAGTFLSWGSIRIAESLGLFPIASVAAEPTPYLLVAGLLSAIAFATLLAVAVPVGRRDPLASLRAD